jgi:hypothetical protein
VEPGAAASGDVDGLDRGGGEDGGGEDGGVEGAGNGTDESAQAVRSTAVSIARTPTATRRGRTDRSRSADGVRLRRPSVDLLMPAETPRRAVRFRT